MSRWQPDARGRLQEAALELYAEHGLEQTTAAQVAARAGLTERTFFRHFGDKREVLFGNEEALRELLASTVAEAPAELSPRAALALGLEAVGDQLQPRRDSLRRRAPIIAAHPELQERELIKLASWSAALAGALRQRGLDEPSARLVAEVAIAVLRVATERWLDDDGDEPDDDRERRLPRLIATALDELESFAASPSARAER